MSEFQSRIQWLNRPAPGPPQPHHPMIHSSNHWQWFICLLAQGASAWWTLEEAGTAVSVQGICWRWWRTEPLADILVRPSLDTWVLSLSVAIHIGSIYIGLSITSNHYHLRLPLRIFLFLALLMIIKVIQPLLRISTLGKQAHTNPETICCHLNQVDPIWENAVAIPPSFNLIFSFIHLSSKGKEAKDDSLNTFVYNRNYINLQPIVGRLPLIFISSSFLETQEFSRKPKQILYISF